MEKLANILGAGSVLVLIGLLWCICPMVVLWSINVISEEATLGFYIPHTVWTYISTIIIVAALRGSSSN